VRRQICGVRHVFHLAYGRDGDDSRKITIDGTRNVVNAAITEGCESVVVLSSAYVFGRPETDQLIGEAWPYSPKGGEYGASKAAMERWCLGRAAGTKRTRVVVLNPTCVYGPQGKTYTRLPAELAAQGQFCWIEDGRGMANYVYVDNLVDAILLAAGCEAAHGKRFLITDGFCTWREFLAPLLGPWSSTLPSYTQDELHSLEASQRARLRDLLRVTASNPEAVRVIDRMRVLGPLKRWLVRKRPSIRQELRHFESTGNGCAKPQPKLVPPGWLADLFAPAQTRFSAELANRVLGWQSRVNLADGQSRTTQWLRELGVLP
jgi:nucleoside-diphosphate-sugar epimerase